VIARSTDWTVPAAAVAEPDVAPFVPVDASLLLMKEH
jgi:hypothetical protein